MGEEEEEFEFEVSLDELIPPVALDNDAIASTLLEFAADNAVASAKLLSSMSMLWAGQFRKNRNDVAMHEEVTREIETLPSTEE